MFGRIKTTRKQLSTFTSRDVSREKTYSLVVSSLDVIRDRCWNTKKIESVTMVVCLRIQNRHVVLVVRRMFLKRNVRLDKYIVIRNISGYKLSMFPITHLINSLSLG